MSEKIIDKVRKLLALSTSSNEHEAALAAQRATEMLLKHNLSLADLEVKKSPYTWHDTPFEQSGWKRSLIYGIAKYNLCDTILSKGGKSLHIVGKQHNIEVVLYLYAYLGREIDRLADLGYKSTLTNNTIRRWKTAFREGAVYEVVERLKDAHQGADNGCRALVVVNTKELDEEMRKRFKNARTVSRHIRADAAAYASGQTAGRSIPLHQGVRGGRGDARRIG